MKNKIIIMSSYLPTSISKEAVEAQRRIVGHFMPEGCDFIQIITRPIRDIHGPTLTKFVNETDYKIYVLLDIDAIPLNKEIIPRMIKEAKAGKLIGCATRNGSRHIYPSPACMAFSRKTYEKLGVDFLRGKRKLKPEEIALEHRDYSKNNGVYGEGWVETDTAEKLTYRAEEMGIPVIKLMPTHIIKSIYKWPDGFELGQGTTYEDDVFHQFETWRGMGLFLKKCKEIEEKINRGKNEK